MGPTSTDTVSREELFTMMRSMMQAAVLGGVFALVGCGGDATDTSTDDLGKTRYHYEPSVQSVTFDGGCGIYNPQNQDCAYGFELTYTKDYIDLTTKVTHVTDNTAKTVEITIDTYSYSQIHPMIATAPQDDDLGLLDAKVGETYKVTVYDRKHVKLWTGKVATLFHL